MKKFEAQSLEAEFFIRKNIVICKYNLDFFRNRGQIPLMKGGIFRNLGGGQFFWIFVIYLVLKQVLTGKSPIITHFYFSPHKLAEKLIIFRKLPQYTFAVKEFSEIRLLKPAAGKFFEKPLPESSLHAKISQKKSIFNLQKILPPGGPK